MIPALRLFRVLRIVRIIRGLRGIRLIRVVSSLNRSMRSLSNTMRRRGFKYVMLLTIIFVFGGAAGMYALEKGHTGFENYGMALWWTGMRIITAGSEYWPITPEGRGLAFIIAIYGYGIFGYVTATLATFFIGRDAEESNAPLAGSKELKVLQSEIAGLRKMLEEQLHTEKKI